MEELRKAKHFKDSQMPVKKTITEEEVEEFLKKMKVQDYSIVEHLRKTPAQISLLSLLIHSDDHCKALMKILNEAHVPDKITVNHLEKIANKIFKANRITFSNDELPMEDTKHKPSSLSHCQLKISTERIHMNSVCVRGFDGGGKDSVGDIMLELSIGPVKFTMEFEVLDVVVSYNLLLDRPWIHAAKAVPSSLHQIVKFEWDMQEIVVHCDEDIYSYNDPSVPFTEVKDDKGLWVYQAFKTVSVEKIPEGECIPGSKLSSASVMVANEILKNGFVLGKGLGSSLQGIVHPVCPRENLGTFGLGFMPTKKDVKRAKHLRQKVWSLPKPVPFIYKSFVKRGAAKRPISSVPKLVVDVDEELIKRFQNLFDEVNMVKLGEGFSNADVHLVGPNVKLSNWEATPLPNRKEFWVPSLKSQSNIEIMIQEVEYDEEATFEDISKELKHFDEKPKPNLHETEAINLGDQDNVRETKRNQEDAEKTTFITPWGTYCYQVMPFGLKNAGATYMRAMTTIFHDMIHREIEVYVDDVIIKSKKQSDHVRDLRKFFQRLRRYNLKLNPEKCALDVPSGKLLGFMVSRRGIELDPSKIKAI
ncbi:uncharacterized protein [Nicotiana tomentosiformis]|uniref:uncharacterized protein n=1 Tax=Nicotiana tomentosiformis TaxID=4098 RepID=UPI00388C5277